MNNFIKKHLEIFIGIIILMIGIILWFLDFKNQSINLVILSSAVGLMKFLFERNFQKIDKKIDHQNQLFLQRAKGGIGFQQYVLENMYDVTNELWKQSVWIAYNWHALWPGYDDDKEKKEKFNKKLDEYKNSLQINSINIPSKIYEGCNNLIKGVYKYEIGRQRGDGEWGKPSIEDKRKGGADMSEGSKMVAESISDLFKTIRKEFGMDNLPSELLDIKQPEEIES